MADNFIQREVTITVTGKTASLSDPIYLYPRDRYIDIFFIIKDAGYQFNITGTSNYGDNASFARVKYIRKDRTSDGVVSPEKIEVIDGKVKLAINDDFMCKVVNGQHEEISPGEYLLQILLYDNNGGRVTIPPVEFEILEPIFSDPLGSGNHTDVNGDLFSIGDITDTKVDE